VEVKAERGYELEVKSYLLMAEENEEVAFFFEPQSMICDLRYRVFLAVKIFLEDSALRGRIALPVKETRFQEARIQRRMGCFDPHPLIYDLISSHIFLAAMMPIPALQPKWLLASVLSGSRDSRTWF